MKKSLLFFIFIVLLTSFAFAEPPVIQASNKEGLISIEFPGFLYHKPTNLTIHIHVFNYTGLPLYNDSTDCFLHLYNQSGSHIIEDDMTFDSNMVDFYKKIPADLLKIGDSYQFIIWCNTSNIGGFISSGFQITETGNSPIYSVSQTQYKMLPVIIFYILVTLTFLAIGIYSKEFWIKFIDFAFALLHTIMTMAIVYLYVTDQSINWLVKLDFYFFVIVGTIVLMFNLYEMFIRGLNPMDEFENDENKKWGPGTKWK